MATFITLGKFTAQGIGRIKDGPQRTEKAKEMARSLGGEMKGFYLTLGQYDFVAITELPDDESAARFALQTGQLGNVSTETLRAFSEGEYKKLIGTLA